MANMANMENKDGLENTINFYHEGEVRPYEVDSQGIVHHSHYCIWAECARFLYFKNLGIDVFMLGQSKKIDLVIKDMKINFIQPLLFGMRYKITCNHKVISKLKFEVNCHIYSNQTLFCSVSVDAVAINRETKKPNRDFIKNYLNNLNVDVQ